VWFDRDGESSEAIRHALAAEDFERAADLTELALPALRRGRQEGAIRNWVEALPDELLRVRPVLNVGFVGALVASGEFEGVEARLRDAERCVQMTANTGDGPEAAADVVVVDEEQFRSVPGAIELYRAAQALVRGDVLETVRHARRTLELAPEDDHLGRAGAAGLMGLAFWSSGDLEEGHLAYSQCVRELQRIEHVSDVMGCSIALADIRLRRAVSVRQCAPTSRHSNRPLSRADHSYGEPQTCT
jgi:LuxR family transcriptional regulator, maltose regulon positive regulatory protein